MDRRQAGRGSAGAGFGLGALERAIQDRRPAKDAGLVAHSDRGGRYWAIRDTERFAEPAVGPFKAEVVRPREPRRNPEAAEFATLEGINRFNDRRPPEPIGHIPPAKAQSA